MAETLAVASAAVRCSPCLQFSSTNSNQSTSLCCLHFFSTTSSCSSSPLGSTLGKHRNFFRACPGAPPLPSERRKRVLSSCCSSIGVTGKDNGSAAIVEQLPFQATDSSGESAFTVVMKFGGSSVASAARMREVAELILSYPDERPIIVLSAMGKTTNNLINAAEIAVTCGALRCCASKEFEAVKNLHLRTADELGVDRSVITGLLDELGEVLKSIATLEDLSNRTRDRLVSFGERLSTRIFADYLQRSGIKARQYDAFEIGFITTDEFTNAEILQETYSAVAERLLSDWSKDPVVPIVTGFLGKGKETRAVTTLGRGGSDLTATAIGKALHLKEVQVWKDVDGVLTCDPSICPTAVPVPYLTYEEAGELAYFGAQVLHPQSMKPAREANIPVRVKNSYNREAPGTLINNSRDLSQSWLTSIVVKRSVTLLDIVSTRMLGQFGFLAEVFSIFAELKISVDVVATSEVSISLTLDPSKIWSRDLIPQELESMVNRLKAIASVNVVQGRSIISLIGNWQRSSLILKEVFGVLTEQNIKVQMISQGALKVNISLIVNDEEAERLVKALHVVFFERECSILMKDSTSVTH